MVALIVAVAENGTIGYQGQMPWGRMPADLRHFKQLTLGHPVVMGRKTFDSIGKALPGRANLVVTRQLGWAAPGCETAASVLSALARAHELDPETVCVIGGGEIFKEAMPVADKIYLTRVDADLSGDVFFPAINTRDWQLVSSQSFLPDEKHAYAYHFQLWERIKA